MHATLLDGARLAKQLLEDTAGRAEVFAAGAGRRACLATVLVGDDPGSKTYVRMKANRCREVGIDSRRVELPATTSTAELLGVLGELSADPAVDGILLQHPTPAGIDERAAFEAITPGKDVDGVTTTSFGALAFSAPGFRTCAPGGMMRLLDAYGVELSGKHAVVVGTSAILGKPAGMMLLVAEATVTYCHGKTVDLEAHVSSADVLLAAVGKPEVIPGEWVKPGAVVLDAGYSPGPVGDVAFRAAAERASLITPVPGGVGPMTIATLLTQTMDAAEAHAGC
jgi:methylenetetrahydrofolate dehydrogenase (NADP+)/methenyltetrahydrofolate cyclohydrolase